MLLRSILVVLALFFAVRSVDAQRMIRVMPVKIKGKIAAVGGGKILVTTPVGETWSVALTPTTQMHVFGMADADALVPGVFVRFIGTVDKKQGRVQEKIDALTIFSPGPTPDQTPGASAPNPSAPAPGTLPKEGAARPQAIPNAMDGSKNAIEPFGFDAPGAKASKAHGKTKTMGPPIEKLEIRGRLLSNKGGKLTIQVPTQQFKSKLLFELAENPKVAINSSHGSLAQIGDAIEVSGRQLGVGFAEATEIRVELSPRVGAVAKKPKKPGAKPPTTDAGHKSADAPTPGEQQAPQQKPDAKTPAAPPPQEGSPAAPGGKVEQILGLLQFSPAELQNKTAVKLTLQDGIPEIFTPCKAESAKNLQEKFGKPDKILSVVVGNRMPGKENQAADLAWQLWTYGSLKIFIDESGTACYYAHAKKEDKPQ